MNKKKTYYIAPLHISQGWVFKKGVKKWRFLNPLEILIKISNKFCNFFINTFTHSWIEGEERRTLREAYFWLDQDGNLVKKESLPKISSEKEEIIEMVGVSIRVDEPMPNSSQAFDFQKSSIIEISNGY